MRAGPADIHVFSLDDPSLDYGAALGLLSLDERKRAEALLSDRERNRFVHSRAALRNLLARYLGREAHLISFRYGARGKPSTDGTFFNLSHAEGLAVIAVSPAADVGIDVERVVAPARMLRLVAEVFSLRERARFEALPTPEIFHSIWTAKEAIAKLSGRGLRTHPSILCTETQADHRLETFSPAPGFLATLAW